MIFDRFTSASIDVDEEFVSGTQLSFQYQTHNMLSIERIRVLWDGVHGLGYPHHGLTLLRPQHAKDRV